MSNRRRMRLPWGKGLYKFRIDGKWYWTCAYSEAQAWFFIEWRHETAN